MYSQGRQRSAPTTGTFIGCDAKAITSPKDEILIAGDRTFEARPDIVVPAQSA